jgi:hypothetical protein
VTLNAAVCSSYAVTSSPRARTISGRNPHSLTGCHFSTSTNGKISLSCKWYIRNSKAQCADLAYILCYLPGWPNACGPNLSKPWPGPETLRTGTGEYLGMVSCLLTSFSPSVIIQCKRVKWPDCSTELPTFLDHSGNQAAVLDWNFAFVTIWPVVNV